MPKPPIWFTRFCYHSDRYHRELHFTSGPIRVLVNKGPNNPTIPFFVHASALWRFSCWFRTKFEAHQRQQREAKAKAKANGTDLGPATRHGFCTMHIPNCDPEVLEMYLNWQYTKRFPIPITMPREDENDYDHGYPYTYWYEHGYEEGDWEGDKEEEEGKEKEVEDYYRDAFLILTKAYLLGHRVRDEYFKREIMEIINEIRSKIVLGIGGLERGMGAFEKALEIVREHHGSLQG